MTGLFRRSLRAALWIALLAALVGLLSGCGRDSGYTDATVSVPSSYASYTVGNLSFRFEPGWKNADWTSLTENMDKGMSDSGAVNKLAIFGRMESSPRDVGTTNYLDFGYLEMGRQVSPQELESIMDTINEMSSPLKKMGISSDELMASRIRKYGSNITALTYCYQVENDQIQCVIKTALIPEGNRVYVISYSDFTTHQLTDRLEEVLSTLTFNH